MEDFYVERFGRKRFEDLKAKAARSRKAMEGRH
jgi:hypothetical protein